MDLSSSVRFLVVILDSVDSLIYGSALAFGLALLVLSQQIRKAIRHRLLADVIDITLKNPAELFEGVTRQAATPFADVHFVLHFWRRLHRQLLDGSGNRSVCRLPLRVLFLPYRGSR